MRAIKGQFPLRATPTGGKNAAGFVNSGPLAQKLSFKPADTYSPSEFAGLLKERFGILVTVRWVQRRCEKGQIQTVRVPYFGRRLIPGSEAVRFAASLEQTTGGQA